MRLSDWELDTLVAMDDEFLKATNDKMPAEPEKLYGQDIADRPLSAELFDSLFPPHGPAGGLN